MGRKIRRYFVGNKYNSLTIIDVLDKRASNGACYYSAVCDCGNLCEVISINIGKQKSCGCLLSARMKELNKKRRQPSCDIGLNRVIGTYKAMAANKDREFTISREYFAELIKDDCFYCGNSPSNESKNRDHDIYYYNGVDRLNNEVGYIIGNVVTCCIICNTMKNDMSYDDFVNHLKKLITNKHRIFDLILNK